MLYWLGYIAVFCTAFTADPNALEGLVGFALFFLSAHNLFGSD